MLESVRLIARFHDMAVMGKPIQQAVFILASTNTLDHSEQFRYVVMTTLVCSYSLDSR